MNAVFSGAELPERESRNKGQIPRAEVFSSKQEQWGWGGPRREHRSRHTRTGLKHATCPAFCPVSSEVARRGMCLVAPTYTRCRLAAWHALGHRGTERGGGQGGSGGVLQGSRIKGARLPVQGGWQIAAPDRPGLQKKQKKKPGWQQTEIETGRAGRQSWNREPRSKELSLPCRRRVQPSF